jgi:hypothetical protein
MTRTRLLLVGLALAVTLLNACKPFTIDDGIYYIYAEHLAHDPLNPYQFTFLGDNEGMGTLVPPVLPYYWAASLHLFGDRPFGWKLALLPFALLLTFSLHGLFRRLAPGHELPLTALTMLSPVCLPCWNYMLDLPALALALTALAVYLAVPQGFTLGYPPPPLRGFLLALLAGLIGGLAMQTKYTAFTLPLVILWHGFLFRCLRPALLAAALMVALFVAWEAWLLHLYGVSHFLVHLGHRDPHILHKLRLVLPLFSTLGAVAPWLGCLYLAALGARVRWVLGLGLVSGVVMLVVALLPEQAQVLARAYPGGPSRLELPGLLYGLVGLVVSGCGLVVIGQLWGLCREQGQRGEWFFLLGWLAIEVLAYFALTPFPAVRRMIGISVVCTLLVGSLLVRTKAVRTSCRWVVLAGVLLGLGFHTLDAWEADLERIAVEHAVERIHRIDPNARIWYATNGSTGAFYAQRAGMIWYLGQPTRPGDWFVAEARVQTTLPRDWPVTAFRERLVLAGGPPLSTMPSYHGSGTPLVHQEGPRVTLLLFRRSQPERALRSPPGEVEVSDGQYPCRRQPLQRSPHRSPARSGWRCRGQRQPARGSATPARRPRRPRAGVASRGPADHPHDRLPGPGRRRGECEYDPAPVSARPARGALRQRPLPESGRGDDVPRRQREGPVVSESQPGRGGQPAAARAALPLPARRCRTRRR